MTNHENIKLMNCVKRILPLLLPVLCVAILAGCKDRSAAGTDETQAREPKTSFGKAVNSAKQLSHSEDARNRKIKAQAEKAFE